MQLDEWLDDQVLDCYCALLTAKPTYENMIGYLPVYLSNIIKKNTQIAVLRKERPTIMFKLDKLQADIAERKLRAVLIPVGTGTHWMLYVIRVPEALQEKPLVVKYDSMFDDKDIPEYVSAVSQIHSTAVLVMICALLTVFTARYYRFYCVNKKYLLPMM